MMKSFTISSRVEGYGTKYCNYCYFRKNRILDKTLVDMAGVDVDPDYCCLFLEPLQQEKTRNYLWAERRPIRCAECLDAENIARDA